jgi:thiol-disulfide isomerase/thioredoxin
MLRLITSIITFVVFIAGTVGNVNAQYTIKGKITGLKDTSIYLANYYGSKLYYNDTARADAKGNFTFPGKPYNECGKYALVLPGPKLIEFIVDQENIYLEADTSGKIENIRVKESENNKVFFDYVRFINDKRKQREPCDKILSDTVNVASESEKTRCKDLIKKLNDEVVAYQKNLILTHPNLLAVKMLKMNMDIEVPDAPAGLSEDDAGKWKYYYYRNHYWDNVDLKDPRLVRDQGFQRMVEKYTAQVMPMIPDTICMLAKQVIDQTVGNEDAFKFIVHHFTYWGETSKIMCMDRVFVFMVENYYKTGKVTWLKEDKMKQIIEASDEKRLCICGEIAPNIILPDTSGHWQSMYDTGDKYTMVVIWESNCGHCKKEIPKLHDLYQKWKGKGLGVYAVENELENKEWKKFVKEKNLTWTNVSDSPEIMKQDSANVLMLKRITTEQSLNYRKYWDVNSTPKVYLLDKDHKVIAKGLSAEQFEELLNKLENGDADPLNNIIMSDPDDEDGTQQKKPAPRPATKNATPPKNSKQ